MKLVSAMIAAVLVAFAIYLSTTTLTAILAFVALAGVVGILAIKLPSKRSGVVFVSLGVMTAVASIALLGATHNEIHRHEVAKVLSIVESQTLIEVVGDDFFDSRVTVQFNGCTVSFRYDLKATTPAGTSWPLVAGTAIPDRTDEGCQPRHFTDWNASMDHSFVTIIDRPGRR